MTNKIKSEEPAAYAGTKSKFSETDDQKVIDAALAILDSRIRKGDGLSSPSDTKDYLRLQLSHEEREVFCCLYLDNRHRVLAFDKLFYGTIDGASVFPREVVKATLFHNAAAVIFCHNHPSGVADPSRADEAPTKRLKDALALIDVRVLDHLVVGDSEVVSMAERGMI